MNELQQTFYSRADAARFFNRLRNPWIRAREERLARTLAGIRPQAEKVLEVGCGEGSNLLYLQSLMPHVYFAGIDFSRSKVDFARQFFPQGHYHCADALSLPFADASFDLVFCRDLLHHVDFNRKGVMTEMVRVVRPGGAVAV